MIYKSQYKQIKIKQEKITQLIFKNNSKENNGTALNLNQKN